MAYCYTQNLITKNTLNIFFMFKNMDKITKLLFTGSAILIGVIVLMQYNKNKESLK